MFTEWNPVKGYIIMEYLEDLKVVHIYENVTPKDLKQERNEYISPFKTLFGAIFQKEVRHRLEQSGSKMEKLAASFFDHRTNNEVFSSFDDGRFAEKGERLKAILPDMVNLDWVDNMSQELGELIQTIAQVLGASFATWKTPRHFINEDILRTTARRESS
ncbi:hypothetical protein COOONC_13525 [Cooperia oncophora]